MSENRIIIKLKEMCENFLIFLMWTLTSVILGCATGAVGALFCRALSFAQNTFSSYPLLVLALPFGGLAIALLYKLFHMENTRGTNQVIRAARDKENVPAPISFLVFSGTFITHIFGGSSGREGAALQIGGSLASGLGRLIRLGNRELHIITMCGMSAGFSAVFGTPLTAAIFAIEVVCVGHMYYSALIPCVISSVSAYLVSVRLGMHPHKFVISSVPEVSALSLLKVFILAAACAAVCILFCVSLKYTGKLFSKIFKNIFVRIFIGGCIIVILTLALGTYDYNGAGTVFIERIFEGGVPIYAFILKILFTSVTMGSGYKGGEIVPSFFVGASFGSCASLILHLPSSFGAGIGLISLFCGATNCPLASLVLSFELFGMQGALFFALAIAVSYVLSGYTGLYSEQKIVYSKYKLEHIKKA